MEGEGRIGGVVVVVLFFLGYLRLS